MTGVKILIFSIIYFCGTFDQPGFEGDFFYMFKRILILYVAAVMTVTAGTALAVPQEKKTVSERAVTEPLEIWGNLRGENSPEPSTEYLEKMAVDFDKINNPLCAAAADGNTKELEYLLRDGASPDSTDSLGISALSHAILGNNKEGFTRLLSAGANMNQKGPFGVTPLMLAANSNLKEMVSLLLLNGADGAIKNDDGETALSIAKRKKLHDVLILLEPLKKPQPQPITPAKPAEPQKENPAQPSLQPEPRVHTLETLAASNSRPAVKTGSKPVLKLEPLDLELLQTLRQGLSETSARLIQAGANPNVRTEEGISPLVIAVSRNDVASAEMLLQHNANADIRSEFDMTPLMLAVQNENPPMIRLLLQRGADPRKENIAGQSACDLGLASAETSIRTLFKRCLQ